MLLVMWTVAPNGWFLGDLLAPADLSASTAQRPGNDHDVSDDHGACSLPRHTIRERIEQLTVRITTRRKPSYRARRIVG
jgi:hypothetical protein